MTPPLPSPTPYETALAVSVLDRWRTASPITELVPAMTDDERDALLAAIAQGLAEARAYGARETVGTLQHEGRLAP